MSIDFIQLKGIPQAYAGPVNLSAPIPGSIGGPIDWWHAGVLGSLNPGVRKATGGNPMSVAQIGSDGGLDSSGAQFTWTDGPGGAGSSTHMHASFVQAPGNGYRITTPAPVWPDWQVIRLWDNVASVRDTGVIVSINDPLVVGDQEFVAYYGNEPRSPEQNDPFRTILNGTVEVRFCSPTPGKVFTLDMVRALNVSMSGMNLLAVALYKGVPAAFPPRASARMGALEGAIGPLGSR